MDIVHTHSYATDHDYVTVRKKLIFGLIMQAVMHLDAVWDLFLFHTCMHFCLNLLVRIEVFHELLKTVK